MKSQDCAKIVAVVHIAQLMLLIVNKLAIMQSLDYKSAMNYVTVLIKLTFHPYHSIEIQK